MDLEYQQTFVLKQIKLILSIAMLFKSVSLMLENVLKENGSLLSQSRVKIIHEEVERSNRFLHRRIQILKHTHSRTKNDSTQIWLSL